MGKTFEESGGSQMTDIRGLVTLPAPTVNIKCVPSDPNWPEHKAMATVDHGEFFPGEIKQLVNDERLQRLMNSGEFVVTEEDPNAVEIRGEIAQKLGDLAADEADEAEKKGISVGALRAQKNREELSESLGGADPAVVKSDKPLQTLKDKNTAALKKEDQK